MLPLVRSSNRHQRIVGNLLDLGVGLATDAIPRLTTGISPEFAAGQSSAAGHGSKRDIGSRTGRNAAQHGDVEGRLRVAAQVSDADPGARLVKRDRPQPVRVRDG